MQHNPEAGASGPSPLETVQAQRHAAAQRLSATRTAHLAAVTSGDAGAARQLMEQGQALRAEIESLDELLPLARQKADEAAQGTKGTDFERALHLALEHASDAVEAAERVDRLLEALQEALAHCRQELGAVQDLARSVGQLTTLATGRDLVTMFWSPERLAQAVQRRLVAFGIMPGHPSSEDHEVRVAGSVARLTEQFLDRARELGPRPTRETPDRAA